MEQFKAYTQSWLRVAQEEPSAGLTPWTGEEAEGPPSHSMPAHVVAKAARAASPVAFAVLHDRLLDLYFKEHRDISAEGTLREVWSECGLEEDAFPPLEREELVRQVLTEHNEALEHGASGVPAVRTPDGFGVVMGAQPAEVYERWIEKLRSSA